MLIHTTTRVSAGATGAMGARGFSVCQKVKADIATKTRKVAPGQSVKLSVRLINRSGGDIEGGRWFIVLPTGVVYTGGSTGLTVMGSVVMADPLRINAQKRAIFTLTVRVLPTASGRLVFRSFLNDPLAYCEATDALTMTVRGPVKKTSFKKTGFIKQLA